MKGMKGEQAVEEDMRERGGDGVMKEAGKGRPWFEAIAPCLRPCSVVSFA